MQITETTEITDSQAYHAAAFTKYSVASILFPFSIDSSLSVATTRLYISIVLKPSVSMAEEEGEKEVESDGPEGSISDV